MIYLITGGTGSLGQAIARELIKGDNTVRIYSRGEYAQWEMQELFKSDKLRFLIGDVRDKSRLSRACNGVDFIIHAAALKHVPICEYNPFEAVQTNIIGTMNVVDCAIDNKILHVLAISSDKACYPVNIYGSTKLSAEHIITDANVYGRTRFASYRPGNYFQSRGNVFELWEKQAKEGYCTLTHTEMRRYYIDIQEAAQIGIECLHKLRGGEVFIPRMKEYLMLDLLKEKYPEVEVRIIGLRPGERLTEPITTDGESLIDKGRYWQVALA